MFWQQWVAVQVVVQQDAREQAQAQQEEVLGVPRVRGVQAVVVVARVSIVVRPFEHKLYLYIV